MSAIAPANASGYSAVAALLNNAASAATGGSPQAGGSATSDAATPSADPTDIVDLSDRAKQVLARAKSEQAAADKLSALVQSLNPDRKNPEAKPKSDDGTSVFDKLSGRTRQQTSDTEWAAGSKYGDPSISDAAFVDKYKDAMLGALTGFPPEKVAALQAAIDSGTLTFQKGSDVPGYNTRTSVTYSGEPGGLQGMSTSGHAAPTGSAKDAIEAGNAFGFWTEDRGDVYVTW